MSYCFNLEIDLNYYYVQIKILAENKETLQLAMKEILQQLDGDLCKIATSKLSDLVIVSKA